MGSKRRKIGLPLIITILAVILAAGFYYYYASRADSSNTTHRPEAAGTDSNLTASVEVPEPRTVSFTFAGDMMFDRSVWHRYKDTGLNHIFDNLDLSLFRNSDISFANLEGPISKKPINDDYASGSMVFNFPPETVSTLQRIGINSVSLANNHTMNAGSSGFANTKSVLESAGIKYAGSQNTFNAENILNFDTKIPVSIITVDILAEIDPDAVASTVKSESGKSKFVIVCPHWGVEYAMKHNRSQEMMAESWIDAGAGMVIGGHPHVVQDVQVYKNRPIVYSLGNFVFDQFFSPETQQGLLLTGTIQKDSLTLTFLPFTDTNVKPKLDSGSVKTNRLKQIFPKDSAFESLKISEDTIKFDLSQM